jgi:hypothetical protein
LGGERADPALLGGDDGLGRVSDEGATGGLEVDEDPASVVGVRRSPQEPLALARVEEAGDRRGRGLGG